MSDTVTALPVPSRQRIRLMPDLKAFTFRGETEISLSLPEGSREILLNAADLEIESCKLIAAEGKVDCSFRLDPAAQELRISPTDPVNGEVGIQLEFTGILNDRMAGFYRTRYVLEGEERYWAVTQFEDIDARRAFPCVDHPGYKAVFDIELVVSEGLSAIANTPIATEEDLESGMRLVRFEPTPRMSTYLLFFGVGDFEILEDSSWRVPIRLAAKPGSSQYGGASILYARQALEFCEGYTGIPYPIGKMDLIAVPDFAFGAMENFGAITYRENYVLQHPGVSSRFDVETMVEITAHEVAHMWYGDLVSPSDWAYIWLNESFATLFGHKISDAYYPDLLSMDQFVGSGGGMSSALRRDSLAATLPVELPTDRHLEIDAATAPIIYSKGACILRMMEGFLGEERFRSAARKLLEDFAYSNANTAESLEAMEAGAGTPLAEMLRGWITQAGFPLVRVRRSGSSLEISQERFVVSARPAEKTLWAIPINIRLIDSDGGQTDLQVVLETEETTVSLPADVAAYKLNHGKTGYYRVSYDWADLRALGALVAVGKLDKYDRFDLLSDLGARLNAGEIEIGEYLQFAGEFFSSEVDYLPLAELANYLTGVHGLSTSWTDRIEKTGLAIFRPALESIGMDPRDADRHEDAILRSRLARAAHLFGDGNVTAHYRELFDSLLDGGEVQSESMQTVLSIGAATRPESLSWFLDQIADESVPETQRRRLYQALGSFQEQDALSEILDYVVTSVPDKNKLHVTGTLCSNRAVRPRLWEWYTKNIEVFASMLHYFSSRIISELVPYGGIGRAEEVTSFFEEALRTHTQLPSETIDMSIELLEINQSLSDRL